MIDMRYGVSFAVRQCRDLGVDWQGCLGWALEQGWRRFRLMSYWNEIERVRGSYDFSLLDEQLLLVGKVGGTVSLCLGVKQPRWPEYHWPEWARDLPRQGQEAALLAFVRAVVERYRYLDHIVSWQLENEALLRGFGEHIQIDRQRLRREFALVKSLDSSRPIIMSTSNGWGVPVRQPVPDIVGFSYYAVMWQRGRYRRTIHRPWLYRLRSSLISLIDDRPSYIHELQLEPWGPQAIAEMSPEQQSRSMSPGQIQRNLRDAQKIGLTPIDLWGLEWWYARLQTGDPSIWQTVRQAISNDGAAKEAS